MAEEGQRRTGYVVHLRDDPHVRELRIGESGLADEVTNGDDAGDSGQGGGQRGEERETVPLNTRGTQGSMALADVVRQVGRQTGLPPRTMLAIGSALAAVAQMEARTAGSELVAGDLRTGAAKWVTAFQKEQSAMAAAKAGLEGAGRWSGPSRAWHWLLHRTSPDIALALLERETKYAQALGEMIAGKRSELNALRTRHGAATEAAAEAVAAALAPPKQQSLASSMFASIVGGSRGGAAKGSSASPPPMTGDQLAQLAEEQAAELEAAVASWDEKLHGLRSRQRDEYLTIVMTTAASELSAVPGNLGDGQNRPPPSSDGSGVLQTADGRFVSEDGGVATYVAPLSRMGYPPPVSADDQAMQETFVVYLGGQVKTAYHIQLVSGTVVDYVRPDAARRHDPAYRRTTASLVFSDSLWGLVLPIDSGFSFTTPAGKKFAHLAELTTEYHFPSWTAQAKAIRSYKPNGMSLGDIAVSRHSNLASLHAVFHLAVGEYDDVTGLAENKIKSTAHPVMSGLKNIVATAGLYDVASLTLPLLMTESLVPSPVFTGIETGLQRQQALSRHTAEEKEILGQRSTIARAEVVLKTLKTALNEVGEAGVGGAATGGGTAGGNRGGLRYIQLVVPAGKDRAIFDRYRSLVASSFGTS